MVKWALIFLVVALVAALFGFTGVVPGLTTIAKALFFACLVAGVGLLAVRWLGKAAFVRRL